MKKCVILCAGGFDGLLESTDDAFVIAADGGLIHARAANISPDVILGDFDSLGYVPQGAEVFPVEKDDTDAMLAVRRGLAEGCREFYLYGGMDGRRLDHTVANFQTLQYLADRGAHGWLIGLEQIATVVKNGKLSFPAGTDGVISVFALGGDARGVTLEGLQYPLKDGVLSCGFPLGVSNHFLGEAASITANEGSLLVLWDRKNGLPQIHRREAR